MLVLHLLFFCMVEVVLELGAVNRVGEQLVADRVNPVFDPNYDHFCTRRIFFL
jgi:hypothetical protein